MKTYIITIALIFIGQSFCSVGIPRSIIIVSLALFAGISLKIFMEK